VEEPTSTTKTRRNKIATSPASTSGEAECLQAMKDTAKWTKIADEPYLDAAETSSLHRILYLPFLHKAKYLSYSLYARQEEEGTSLCLVDIVSTCLQLNEYQGLDNENHCYGF
jgi:hypothetical protein